jgi:hypothetical protein
MSVNPITNDLVEKIRSTVLESISIPTNALRFEVQDDFRFLLISIDLELCAEHIRASDFRSLAIKLSNFIPTRDGEYSWMLNIARDKKVVDSYFGGDALNPGSGL